MSNMLQFPGDTYYATDSYPNNASDKAEGDAGDSASKRDHPQGAADTSSMNDPAGWDERILIGEVSCIIDHVLHDVLLYSICSWNHSQTFTLCPSRGISARR